MSVNLSTQHAMRMRRSILPSVACILLYFSTLSHKQHDFWGEQRKAIGSKMYVLIFTKTFV